MITGTLSRGRTPPSDPGAPVDDRLVVVRPVAGGWSVEADAWGEGLMFHSAPAAEDQARRISTCLARLGVDVRVDVYDRRNLLSGCFRIFADP